jgi:predicted GNAT family acetyltransferase
MKMDYIYEENRIYAQKENGLLLAEVTFPARDENRVNVDHKGLLIIAKCPYAISWFKKHPEYQDIVINVKTK